MTMDCALQEISKKSNTQWFFFFPSVCAWYDSWIHPSNSLPRTIWLDGMLLSIPLQPLCHNDTYGMIGRCYAGWGCGLGWKCQDIILPCPSTALVSGYINLHLLLQCLVFKQTFKSNAAEPVIHLCVSIPFKPLLAISSTVMNGWTRLEPWWLKEICNQHPVKGRDGAAVRPYCSPIKTPTNLDRCKSPNPDYRLFADGQGQEQLFSRAYSGTFHLLRKGSTLLLLYVSCCIPLWISLKLCLHCNLPWRCSKHTGNHLLMATCMYLCKDN